ncbi:DUF1697 domain-containing protein [Acidimangrovimonas pyrenivorans]|uniref:DUF1697 domain-containing protein n=1 Tax=Acidimangrovimonas pyrenivorans TaxID=2030798 RepID=A0ABV7AKJ1_9RHOB
MSDRPTRIALLRGVNVGGRGRLPMADFRALLAGLGYGTPQTYIQSGNAVFRAAGPAEEIATAIGKAIAASHGFRPHVLLRSLAEIEAALAACPFRPAPGAEKTVQLYFLDPPPGAPDLAALEALRAADEEVALAGKVFYLSAPSGIGRSKLAAAVERHLGTPATARNLRSVRAIRDLARTLPN